MFILISLIISIVFAEFVWRAVEDYILMVDLENAGHYLIVKSGFKAVLIFVMVMPQLPAAFYGLFFLGAFALSFWDGCDELK